MTERVLEDPAATHALGVLLGRSAFPGAVIALCGDLGAGKTALVRGLAEGLGCPGPVQSPSYVLSMRHEGRIPLVHADAWRLGSADELDDLELLEEASDGVLALEWADRFVDALPADHLRIELRPEGEGRVARIESTGPRHRPLEVAAGG
ncbi:MAG: tRNA (adenosine(37)-N6)-threonylcarbamoyltransferase complex ATPase subunit type 1 TsaE [Alphaproteobacteria bacterium]|nr:tRNA (adenosine(37)-N6)-threonylcarbamoyltransferase complex ATPase subunit type 1 TsaE [Alphaproteobacteria bacterium]MCB9699488.1 tRNA (adenosine(37)-N6)-threonylcarbamoyltransferase complex ATPase subunit type 1 TsaE [Alphaproteobacteria bacterium]